MHLGKKSYRSRRLAPRRASGHRGSCGGKESEETSMASGHIAGVLREISAREFVVHVVGTSTWGVRKNSSRNRKYRVSSYGIIDRGGSRISPGWMGSGPAARFFQGRDRQRRKPG